MASCSYIKDLILPKQFAKRIEDVIQKGTANGRFPRLERQREYNVGRNRFANEHWIHTHPDCQPCDLVDSPTYMWDYPTDSVSTTKSWRAAPRFAKEAFFPTLQKRNILPFVELDYRLFELEALYGRKPNNDSWVWKYYQ